MRGLKVETQIRRAHLLHGAATLAVLSLRTDQSGDTWHSTRFGDGSLPTTSTLQRESTLQAPIVNGTPTSNTSSIHLWKYGNDKQHDLSGTNNNVLISRSTDFDVSLPPNNQLQARQTSEQIASPASLPASASRKRCAETELYFQSPKEPHIEEVAQLLSENPAQSVEILEHLIQTLDTEVQGYTDKHSDPDYNPTDLPITPNELQTSQKEPVKNTKQMGILDQASTSDDSQYNATHPTKALDVLDGVGNEKMLTITRGTATSLPKPMHGTAHLTAPLINLAQHSSDQIEDTRPAHSSSHDINGAGPARPATIPDCSITSDHRQLFPRVEPSSGRSDTMGYVQRPDKSGNLCLYPVSYADHPGALPFDYFLTPGVVQQIVLPQNLSQYIEAMYDSVKRFVKKFRGSEDLAITETKRKHCETENDPFIDFRVIRGRSAHHFATVHWKGLIPSVEGWLMSRDPYDNFARFALGYLKVLCGWRRYQNVSERSRDAVAAWCDEHQGLPRALKLAAAREPSSTGNSLIMTLPDIYLKTCPYFLMYAVHHPGPEKRGDPGTSMRRYKSELGGKPQLLYELTNAAYLWQMVLHIRGQAAKPKWPSQPLITKHSMYQWQRERRVQRARSNSGFFKSRKRRIVCYQMKSMSEILDKVFKAPLEIGRFRPEVLSPIQALESSSGTTPLSNTSGCYEAIGSFTNDAATRSGRKIMLRNLSIRDLMLVEDDLMESFWRLRVLFHVNTCKTFRYQLDKLIVETESKMKSGLLPKDAFLSFACDYLRAMRTLDKLSNARRRIRSSSDAVRGTFRYLSNKYKITDAVKKVAELESQSSGPRMLPEIYKTHPASSLLPYVIWFDTSKPDSIRRILNMAGITEMEPDYRDRCQGRYKAKMLRLLTIIAEIWSLREIDNSTSQASPQEPQRSSP